MKAGKTNPLVSIIVPIYNVERWLQACIDSIIKQQYANFQLLLINDGSTDESERICRTFQDERIEYYCIPHSGVAVARNVGLKHAQGEYIAFIDSDDIVHPLFLSNLLTAMIQYDADVVGCRWSTVDSNCLSYDDPLAENNESIHVIDGMQAIKECRVSDKLNGWINTVIWNKLFKSEIAKNESFDPRFSYGEDTKWLWPVLKKANRYVLLNDYLYGYRKTNEKKAYRTFCNMDQYYRWEYQYLQDLGLDENVLNEPLQMINKMQLLVDIEQYIDGECDVKNHVLQRWRTHFYNASFPPKKLGRIKLWLCLQLMIWGVPRNIVRWVYRLSQ